MLVFIELSYLPKDKVMKIKDNLCIDEEESQLFDMLIFQNKSAQQMADRLHKSPRTIFRMMARLKRKIINEMQYENILA